MSLNDRNPQSEEVIQPWSKRGLLFQLAALALTVVSVLAGIGLSNRLKPQPAANIPSASQANSTVQFPNRLFTGWKDPDLVLLVSGQQIGYLLPCGCSRPQYGGLERRYNLIQLFKEAGWPYVAVDLGDIVQRQGIVHLPNQQGLLKYVYSMRALKEMGYSAVGIGESEVFPGLLNLLAEYALNYPKPRVVVSNLIDAENNFPGMTVPWELVEPARSDIKVGVAAIIGPTIEEQIKKITRNDKTLQIEATPKALDRIVREMASKRVNLPILLYQGLISRNQGMKPYTEAMGVAEAYPQFPIVVALSEADDPSMRPLEIVNKAGSKSMIVTLGKKGRFVGVFGIWKTNNPAKPFDIKYERVELGEEFMTPEHKEKGHPIIELIESYTKELKEKNYLEKYGQIRHELQVLPEVDVVRKKPVEYAGSEACKRCHEHAYDVWKKSKHSHAYQTLVEATRPGNRQYDPECIVCHTVGYGYVSGYINATLTPKLKDVGCESCHGPSLVHVHNPDNKEWHKRINPWKYLPKEKRVQAMDDMCQKCHDIDNDVHWVNDGFKRKWPEVEHMTPAHEKGEE